ncbi:MAG: phosphatase PAP2 family protein [Clostridia bacterium]|nr:phosphatase PAP2 family protein [Clostridia bacterium]
MKLLWGWVLYFLLYFLTENLIPAENCHVIHSRLDDMIPFCEWFLIPYVFWYGWIVFSLVYFLRYDVENFKKLQTYIMITQAVAMLVYMIYPNCQNLRPEVFPRDNVFTDCIGMIYQFDTNTGVFPSLHCAYSIAIASVWIRRKETSHGTRIFSMISALLVCLSTMFIKQHSVLDFFGAILLCLLAEFLVNGVFYKKK